MNIKAFLRKRQFLNNLRSFLVDIKKAVVNSLKFTFAKRQILFVTNQKIRTVTLGPFSQLCFCLAFAWIANLFYESLQYNKIISAKSEEIARLRNVANYFDAEFSNINDKLKKVNDYLISVTGENTLVGEETEDLQLPKNLNEENLSSSNLETVDKIREASNKMFVIKKVAQTRIERIEKTIAITGLNIKKPTKSVASLMKKYPKLKNSELGQGGPFIPLENFSASEVAIKHFSFNKSLDTAKFSDEIDRLIMLEKLTQFIPLSRPIKNYMVSSGFGPRVDPLTGGMAVHQGLDFVGPSHEQIISPSSGVVILAGKFSDYGNAVVIDHGFGITTRYGHLSKVIVQKGQIVKKGDLLARQGSTGRSTGQHLHYEVRYKNIPLNPRKFLEAGDSFFNKSTQLNHANS